MFSGSSTGRERTHFALDNVSGGSKCHFAVPVQMAFDEPNMKEMGRGLVGFDGFIFA